MINGRNPSNAEGGCLINFENLRLEDCEIRDSVSTRSGGGIFSFQPLTLVRCTVDNNSATNNGGGILTQSQFFLTDTTLSRNTANGNGGGAYHDFSSSGVVMFHERCTFAQNSAREGGGLFQNSGLGTLKRCTITGNTATDSSLDGAGVYVNNAFGGNARLTLQTSLIADNNGEDLHAGSRGGVASSDHNLIGDGNTSAFEADFSGTPVFGGASNPDDSTNVSNMRLAPLGDWGGPTETMPPLYDSIAVDRAPSDGSNDQRGLGRFGSGDEVGSTEYFPIGQTLVGTDTDGDDMHDDFEAIWGFIVGDDDGDEDLDKDGSRNKDELRNRTNPRDGNSKLKITSFGPTAKLGTTALVVPMKWTTHPGISYSLQQSDRPDFSNAQTSQPPNASPADDFETGITLITPKKAAEVYRFIRN
ncbi:MAG: right-handed parallel beta-helix repeat-containing protein [Verrucomicrobiota bacterium]